MTDQPLIGYTGDRMTSVCPLPPHLRWYWYSIHDSLRTYNPMPPWR